MEPYDHAEQMAAFYGNPARGDLLRWARRDAKPFLAEHPLPDEDLPSPDLAPYLAALAAAETPAEVSAVTQHLIDAAESVLHAVRDYLCAAGQRGRHQHEVREGSPPGC